MTNPHIAMLAGALFVLLGGIVLTASSLNKCTIPEEHRFMGKVALFAWVSVALFIGALYYLTAQYRVLLCGIYALLAFIAIPYCNKQLSLIRQIDRSNNL